MKCKERVLFYTSVPRLFRTTYIGHLYDLAQKYKVILVSEKLDSLSEEAVRDKRLFPNIEKIVSVNQYSSKRKELWESHRYFSHLAKKIITENKPDFVIADSMINSFEKYLFRYGKLSGACTVIFQAAFQPPSIEDYIKRQILLWRDSGNNSQKNIKIRELKIRLVKLKEHFAEVLDYWIYPILVGTYPFYHKSLFRYSVGPEIKDIDFIVVFSEQEAELERKIGRPEKAIKILPHPLQRNAKKIFEKVYGISKIKGKIKKENDAVTIMIDVDTFGHRKEDLSLISEDSYLKNRLSVINLLIKMLPSWRIFIKPHPMSSDAYINFINKYYAKNSKRLSIVNPKEPADKYIERSNIIIGFPPPSTTLFTSMLLSNKLVVYIDLFHELMGDAFDGYKNIKYADSYTTLKKIITRSLNPEGRFITPTNREKLSVKTAADIINEINVEKHNQ